MNKAHGVATATGQLVSNLAREIVAVDIAQVEALWDFFIGNVTSFFILLEGLNSIEGNLEGITIPKWNLNK